MDCSTRNGRTQSVEHRLTHYLAPHGRTVMAVRNPDRLARLDIDTGEWIELPPAAGAMYGKDAEKLFSPHDWPGLSEEGRTFAYAAGVPETKSFVVQLWDVRKRTATEISLERRGFSPVFTPDGRTLAVWVDGGNQASSYVLILDMPTGREIGHMITPPAALSRLKFSPDGQTLAASGFGPPPQTMPSYAWVQLSGCCFAQIDQRNTRRKVRRLDSRRPTPVLEGRSASLLDGRTGAKVSDWNPPGLSGKRFFRGTFARGSIAIVESVQTSALRVTAINRLAAGGVISYEHFRDYQKSLHLYDSHTGDEKEVIWIQGQDDFSLSPDGQTLATLQFTGHIDRKANIYVWDLPPRTPGGIVLGLMIGEVALAIAWTAWRRRRGQDRPNRCGRGPTAHSMTASSAEFFSAPKARPWIS